MVFYTISFLLSFPSGSYTSPKEGRYEKIEKNGSMSKRVDEIDTEAISPELPIPVASKKQQTYDKINWLAESVGLLKDPGFIMPNPANKLICVISYMIYCKKPKDIHITVVSYRNMVKIFYKSKQLSIKCIERNNKYWAAFTIYHIAPPMSIEQIRTFSESNLEFKCGIDSKYAHQKAKMDSPQLHYAPQPCGSEVIFMEARPVRISALQNLSRISVLSHPESILSELNELQCPPPDILTPPNSPTEDTSSDHALCLPADLHRKFISMSIMKNLEEEPFVGRETSKDPKLKTTKGKTISVKLGLEEMFYGKPVWYLKGGTKLDHSISNFNVFFSVKDLLDGKDMAKLTPICVKIEKVLNLPLEGLDDIRFDDVSIQYELGTIIPTTTIFPSDYLENKQSLIFDSLTTFFIDSEDITTVFEEIQSKKLTMKIFGVRNYKTTTLKGSLFGCNLDDSAISNVIRTKIPKPFTTPQNHRVLLGVAQLDVSPLAFGKILLQAHVPIVNKFVSHGTDERNQFAKYIKYFNLMDVHNERNPGEEGLLKRHELILNNTMLKVQVKAATPLNPLLLQEVSNVPIYHRAVIIFYSPQSATQTLKNVLSKNKLLLGLKNYDLPFVSVKDFQIKEEESTFQSQNINEYEASPDTDGDTESIELLLDRVLTGFCIDCVDKSMLFIESLKERTVSNILTELIGTTSQEARVLFNSEIIFTSVGNSFLCSPCYGLQNIGGICKNCLDIFLDDQRLYNLFQSLGGIYCITMKEPIEVLCQKYEAALEGFIPIPAWRALHKLNRLIYCKTIHEAIQNGLLPTPQQLFSFDIEFGLATYITV